MYRFLCLLNIQIEMTALGTGDKDGLSRCSSTTIFLSPVKLLITEVMDLSLLLE